MALQAGQEGNKLELNLQNEEAKKLQEMKWLRIDRIVLCLEPLRPRQCRTISWVN